MKLEIIIVLIYVYKKMAKTFTNNDMINELHKMYKNELSIESLKTILKDIKEITIKQLKEGKKIHFLNLMTLTVKQYKAKTMENKILNKKIDVEAKKKVKAKPYPSLNNEINN